MRKTILAGNQNLIVIYSIYNVNIYYFTYLYLCRYINLFLTQPSVILKGFWSTAQEEKRWYFECVTWPWRNTTYLVGNIICFGCWYVGCMWFDFFCWWRFCLGLWGFFNVVQNWLHFFQKSTQVSKQTVK